MSQKARRALRQSGDVLFEGAEDQLFLMYMKAYAEINVWRGYTESSMFFRHHEGFKL